MGQLCDSCGFIASACSDGICRFPARYLLQNSTGAHSYASRPTNYLLLTSFLQLLSSSVIPRTDSKIKKINKTQYYKNGLLIHFKWVRHVTKVKISFHFCVIVIIALRNELPHNKQLNAAYSTVNCSQIINYHYIIIIWSSSLFNSFFP